MVHLQPLGGYPGTPWRMAPADGRPPNPSLPFNPRLLHACLPKRDSEAQEQKYSTVARCGDSAWRHRQEPPCTLIAVEDGRAAATVLVRNP